MTARPLADPAAGPGGQGSIQDVIEAELRERILVGDIEPGGRINVRQLEQHFGVSHIPIREAIHRLEAEGLVVNVPRRGAIAAGVSLKELDEIYDLRRILEPRVAHRAVDAMQDDDLAALTAAYDTLIAAEQGADAVEFSAAHWQFHWQVLRPGCTNEIRRLLEKLWRIADRYVRLTRGTAVDVAHEQHHQLYDACVAADGTTAETILEAHLHLTGDALRAELHHRGLQ